MENLSHFKETGKLVRHREILPSLVRHREILPSLPWCRESRTGQKRAKTTRRQAGRRSQHKNKAEKQNYSAQRFGMGLGILPGRAQTPLQAQRGTSKSTASWKPIPKGSQGAPTGRGGVPDTRVFPGRAALSRAAGLSCTQCTLLFFLIARRRRFFCRLEGKK